jgi:hypothetical protein
MVGVSEAVVVTRLILDIIQMYNDNGVEVDLDTLQERIADEQAKREKLKSKLKGKVSV